VFSRVENDVLIDSIPLCEIKSVDQFDEAKKNVNHQTEEEDLSTNQFQDLLKRRTSMSAALSDLESPKQESNPESKLDHESSDLGLPGAQKKGGNSEVFTRMMNSQVIQIKTDREGHNSGRTYYLRVNQDLGQITTRLSIMAKSAREKAENKSRFERHQLKVRRTYNSSLFQYFVAALIVGVIYFMLDFIFASCKLS
jgi:hypothetical protein